MKKVFVLITVFFAMFVNLSVSNAALIPVSDENVDDFYAKIRTYASRIKNSNLVFTKLVSFGQTDLQTDFITGNKQKVNLLAGQFGIKNSGSYQCMISYGLDNQNKCLMIILENSSRNNQGQKAVLDVFIASLVALDLTDSELKELLTNLETMEKKNSGSAHVNVWSSKNSKYIVVSSTKTSASIFASDVKLF